MAKESVLTQREKDTIEIKSFIFHIIISDADSPEYLEKVILTDRQKKFFKDRLIEASAGTQYIFVDKTTSEICSHCERILENPRNNFLPYSKKLTSSFHSYHRGNTTDGVFIVSLVTILSDKNLIFLIKMDQNQVLQYKIQNTEAGRVATMEEIVNSFVEDKRAMQKVAIIDVDNHYSWDVLASDRVKTEGIADYFKSFLTPAIGPLNQGLKDISYGRYGEGALQIGIGIADVALIESVVIRGGGMMLKAGVDRTFGIGYSANYNAAVSRWRGAGLVNDGYFSMEGVKHHWFISQSTMKQFPALKPLGNQIWNIKTFPNQALHMSRAHGQNYGREIGKSLIGRMYYSTPNWLKAGAVSGGGRTLD